MKLRINIKDESKNDFFMSLLKELSFVEIIDIDDQVITYENNTINDIVEDINQKYDVKEKIVAYSIDGKPLNKDEYLNEILEAEKDIEKGNFTTHEDLKKEIETWHK